MPLLSEKICSLFTPDILSKLKEHGIKSVGHMLSISADKVTKQTEIPYKDVEAIQHSLRCQFSVLPVSCCELLEKTAHIKPLPTGSTGLDELLNGGLVRGQLTEVCGTPASGKTQFCLCVTSEVVMTTASSVAYVDDGCGFNARRLKQMFQKKSGYEDKEVNLLMDRVRVYHAFSIFDLLSFIETLKENIAEQVDCFHSNLHLLIIDPITFFISPLLGGGQTHGHALMSQVAMAMKVLAHEQSISVLYTNNVVVDRTHHHHRQRETYKPAMGVTWSHVPSTRIMFTRATPSSVNHNSENERVATLIKSSRQAVGKSIVFSITDSGLE